MVRKIEERMAKSLSVNIVAVVGALIALGGLFLPWTHSTQEGPLIDRAPVELTGLDYAQESLDYDRLYSIYGVYMNELSLCVWLFIAGVVVSFFSTLGGIVSMGGLLEFYRDISPTLGTTSGHAMVTLHNLLWVGFYVCLIGTVIVLISSVIPFWIGKPVGELKPIQRLMVILSSPTM